MKKNELVQLRELVEKEKNRRVRIKELLDNELVKEYLLINDIEPVILDYNNTREIIENILKTFNITKTNGIYVCTNAYYFDCQICYEETDYYQRNVNINSKYAEYKIYNDIENGESIKAIRKQDKYNSYRLIDEFEDNNIVLNPFNTSDYMNGYNNVRLDFFENSINYGQVKSKNLLLKKYPRIK